MLYFENRSADTADAYLAEGLTEAIILRLGSVERLAVQSRSAVRRVSCRAPDPKALGNALQVTNLVCGNIRRTGDRLRITVELLRAASGVQLWSERYDVAATDLLIIEESIARAIATAVTGRLLPQERSFLTARATQNPEAYDHFLRGNYYYAKRTRRALTLAIVEYDSAARLDSSFTAAIARSAQSRFQRGGLTDSSRTAALATAARAIRQDSNSAEAWIALGYARIAFGSYDSVVGAREAVERAVAADPSNADAHHLRGGVLHWLGDDSAAVMAHQRALVIDPDRAITLVQLAGIRHAQRRYGEARRRLDSAVVVDPDFLLAYAFRARVRLRLGDLAGAREDARITEQLGSSEGGNAPWLAELAWGLIEAAEGDTAAAHRRALRLFEPGLAFMRAAERGANPISGNMAPTMALAAAGESERAMDLLELFRQDLRLRRALAFPEFDPLRTHPRFQRLLAESRPR